MDSIATARDFFINQQGMSPDQADMIVSQGLQAYNQQTQPQSMMQMASGGIARLGYQMGGSPMGVEPMPMDYGQSLQVPPQQQPSFSSARNITMNPLTNYGQPELGAAGGTPLTMRGGGIARLGYQMGGDVGMSFMGGEESIQMDQQQALQTIIQILIDNGVSPEQAQQLALQILQIFMQGGAPAVEAFANQLEQEEVQEMASGGIAGLYPRQGYFVGKIVKSVGKAVSGAVKGVAKAVKSVAKSDIGRIALTIAAVYALGPAGLNVGASMASTPWVASAINAGLANTLVQGITTGKFNPKEALLAAGIGGLTSGLTGPSGADTSSATSSATNITGSPVTDITASPVSSASTAQALSSPTYFSPTELTSVPTGLEGQIGTGYAAPKPNLPFQLQGAGNGSVIDANAITSDYSYPSALDKIKTSVSNYGTDLMNKAQTGITNLYQDPLGTITKLAGSAYDSAKENAIPLALGFSAGIAAGSPQQPNESDEDFAKRQQEESNLSLTQLGRNLKITNPEFYTRYGAVNPFATTMAANGGIMGYAKGGSMVPPARQIEGGIIELDARKTGGYIPYGKKERVDDVPAMLAKDEFVFTSRAVKAAGGGSARRGAAKMYALMKQLESKGARA